VEEAEEYCGVDKVVVDGYGDGITSMERINEEGGKKSIIDNILKYNGL